MAKLTTAARNKLKGSSFAGPNRSYPIQDRSHAQNAKARASQFASPAVKARVDAAVKRKYGFSSGGVAGQYYSAARRARPNGA